MTARTRLTVATIVRDAYDGAMPAPPCGIEGIAGGAVVYTASARDARVIAGYILDTAGLPDTVTVTVEPYDRHPYDPDLHTTHRVVVHDRR
jgi:hypothetical protein